ncbi:MAG: DUF2312 domain-containing protein [Alphaproteobacteria bacterium]|nr:DUF2312 domain-containing protein [Alphaproteobacteria bacterium]NCQ67065.1 DUF2312 domain-containing protein [Alphaproteobacteria bacterium]NCT07662.1 DUF2312 domain-containing protein [Alphaproteobacteria bacterium]
MTTFAGISGAQLRQFIEQVEYLEEQKAALASDTREVFAEAKSAGFDVKVIRQILKMRKMDQDELRELEEVLDVYLQALNMSSRATKKTDEENNAPSDTQTKAEAA